MTFGQTTIHGTCVCGHSRLWHENPRSPGGRPGWCRRRDYAYSDGTPCRCRFYRCGCAICALRRGEGA